MILPRQTAKEHYENGITASMKFYGITGTAVTNYLAGPKVAFNAANAIPMIITKIYYLIHAIRMGSIFRTAPHRHPNV